MKNYTVMKCDVMNDTCRDMAEVDSLEEIIDYISRNCTADFSVTVRKNSPENGKLGV